MRKLVVLILFTTSSFVLPAQNSRIQNICASPDSSVKVMYELNGSDMQRYITFEKKGKQDTLFLDYSNEFNSNNCRLTQLQIDGEGLMEIHLVWTFNRPFGLGYIGGESSWDEQEEYINHEVWNLDSKERLFSVVSYYFHHSYESLKGVETNRTTHYQCDFEMNEKGTITISNNVQDAYNLPQHEEGVYRFVDGAYVKV